MNCAWPLGDPLKPDFCCCGKPVARPGLPYCPEHMVRAYRKASPGVRMLMKGPSRASSPAPEPRTRWSGEVPCRKTIRPG
jgi:hypothetical protein